MNNQTSWLSCLLCVCLFASNTYVMWASIFDAYTWRHVCALPSSIERYVLCMRYQPRLRLWWLHMPDPYFSEFPPSVFETFRVFPRNTRFSNDVNDSNWEYKSITMSVWYSKYVTLLKYTLGESVRTRFRTQRLSIQVIQTCTFIQTSTRSSNSWEVHRVTAQWM